MADVEHSSRPIYHVIDIPSGKTVGKYMNKTRARNEVDKRDNQHGGYRHRLEERHPQEANAALVKHGAGQSYDEISAELQKRMKHK